MQQTICTILRRAHQQCLVKRRLRVLPADSTPSKLNQNLICHPGRAVAGNLCRFDFFFNLYRNRLDKPVARHVLVHLLGFLNMLILDIGHGVMQPLYTPARFSQHSAYLEVLLHEEENRGGISRICDPRALPRLAPAKRFVLVGRHWRFTISGLCKKF